MIAEVKALGIRGHAQKVGPDGGRYVRADWYDAKSADLRTKARPVILRTCSAAPPGGATGLDPISRVGFRPRLVSCIVDDADQVGLAVSRPSEPELEEIAAEPLHAGGVRKTGSEWLLRRLRGTQSRTDSISQVPRMTMLAPPSHPSFHPEVTPASMSSVSP